MSKKLYLTKLAEVLPHPNADKLRLGITTEGYQVIVGLEQEVGDEGFLFLPDAILTEKANEVFGSTPYLQNNRVRAIKLRGERSEALFIPMDGLVGEVEVGKLNDEAYYYTSYNPKPEVKMVGGKKVSNLHRRETPTFPMHFNTEQYRNNVKLVEDALASSDHTVTTTLKMHGTSQRTGLVLDANKLTWWQKVVNLCCSGKYPTEEYKLMNGTRRVIISRNDESVADHESYRDKAAKMMASLIKPGEVWYYEIVGFTETGAPIMPMDDGVPYSYGCQDDEFRICVYRITVNGADLSWSEIRKLFMFRIDFNAEPDINIAPRVGGGLIGIEGIDHWMEILEGNESLWEEAWGHKQEGLCIRIDGPTGTKILKHKTFRFLESEGRT